MTTIPNKLMGHFFMSILTLFTAAFILQGCSGTEGTQNFRRNAQGEKMFSFYDYKDGHETHWKVYFRDDSITALYKNGSRISSAEVKNYSDMIYDKIDDIAALRSHGGNKDRKIQMFRFNDDDLNLNMDRMKKDLKDQKHKIKIKVDKNLKDKMKKLSIEMNKLKGKDFHIQPEMKEHIKKFRYNMKEHSDSSDTFVFQFDSKTLEEDLKELAEDLEDIEIDIDIPEIHIYELDDSLKDLDIELKELDIELENLDKFFDELKSEMLRDKLIGSEEDKINLRLEEEKMYINDKEVSAELFIKYKELYKKHTGKEFNGDRNIQLKITP